MIDKRDRLDTLTVGDWVVWPEGCNQISGRVERVYGRTVVLDINDQPVVIAICLSLACPSLPTYDEFGWPKSKAGILKRVFNLYTSSIYYAYTPDMQEA